MNWNQRPNLPLRTASCVATACFLMAASLPMAATAETFVVTLTNGNVFLSKYEPAEAPWDASKLLIMTDVGNTITLDRAFVETIESDTENRGFGNVIDTTTIEVGFSPNNYVDPEEAADPNSPAAMLQTLRAQSGALAPPRPAAVFNTPLIAEPNSSGGIPLNFVNSITPPLGSPNPNN